MARIKREILTRREVVHHFARAISSCFVEKDAFQNVSLSEKKIDTAFSYGFSKCQPTREPV